MPDVVKSEAYVTLATNDSYGFGALVLSQSLRSVNATRQLVVLFTSEVSQEMRDQLLYAFDLMVQVDVLDSKDSANLELLTRPDLGVTFTKLHCWRLTQFEKCVFLDADTMVVHNVDELFEREELSAAPDVGWPDCFNSGVFVFRPSEETYASLLQHAFTHGSFDGGDQGLLNSYFSKWSTEDIRKHLPFVYNFVAQSFYSYLPALKQYGANIKIVHFIGPSKPWTLGYNRATGEVEGHSNLTAESVHRWWNVFLEKIHYRLTPSLSSKVNVFTRHPPQVFEPQQQPIPVELTSISPVSENHQMTSPFIPPCVTIYYKPEPPVSDVHEVVVNQESRPFHHFESFYSEPPMNQGEDHPYAGEMYHASEFSNVLTEFASPSGQPPFSDDLVGNVEDHTELESSSEPEPSVQPGFENKPSNEVELLKSQNNNSEAVIDSKANSQAALTQTSNSQSEDPAKHASETNEAQSSTISGASNLKMYSKQQLGDLERQFNWERGQIDYLGIDSFDNILKQLEGSINEPLIVSTPELSPSPDVNQSNVDEEQEKSKSNQVFISADESEKACTPAEE